MWDLALPAKKGHSPQFSAPVCFCKTAGWIKIPLATEVGLGPGDIVLDGDPALQKGGTAPRPIFGLCPLWPNGGASQLLLRTCYNRPKSHETSNKTFVCYAYDGPAFSSSIVTIPHCNTRVY